MLTVPEAAQKAGRDPETIRRWIRSGKLRAHKIGTQHVIEEPDLDAVLGEDAEDPLPPEWRTMRDGRPMPKIVAAIRRSRQGH